MQQHNEVELSALGMGIYPQPSCCYHICIYLLFGVSSADAYIFAFDAQGTMFFNSH